jgi:hypothetical protein
MNYDESMQMMEIAHEKSCEIRWKPPHEGFVRKKSGFCIIGCCCMRLFPVSANMEGAKWEEGI